MIHRRTQSAKSTVWKGVSNLIISQSTMYDYHKKFLLSKQWRSMSEGEILGLFDDEVMNGDNFFYLELVLDWLKFNNMSRKCLREVWDRVNQSSLCWEYLVNVKIHFQNHVRDKTFELPLTHFPSSNYALRWYHVPLTKGGTNSEVADLVKMKRLQVVMSPTSGIIPENQKKLYVSLEMFRRYPSYRVRASNGQDSVTMGRCWLELERTAAHCEYERVSMVTSTWDEIIHRLKTIDVIPWGYSTAPKMQDWYSSDVYLCGMVNNVPLPGLKQSSDSTSLRSKADLSCARIWSVPDL